MTLKLCHADMWSYDTAFLIHVQTVRYSLERNRLSILDIQVGASLRQTFLPSTTSQPDEPAAVYSPIFSLSYSEDGGE